MAYMSFDQAMGWASDESDKLIIYEDNAEQIAGFLTRAIASALEAVGIEAEGDAKELCPVDTGRLRNSITHAIDAGEKAVYIGTNVEYAPYIELGTSTRAAQPFLLPTAQNNADKYRDIARSMLEGA